MSLSANKVINAFLGSDVEIERERCARICEEYANAMDNEHTRTLGVAEHLKAVVKDLAYLIREG